MLITLKVEDQCRLLVGKNWAAQLMTLVGTAI